MKKLIIPILTLFVITACSAEKGDFSCPAQTGGKKCLTIAESDEKGSLSQKIANLNPEIEKSTKGLF